MSGGSYNYLCHKDADDIHERRQELSENNSDLFWWFGN
jgi:hypothetical protein